MKSETPLAQNVLSAEKGGDGRTERAESRHATRHHSDGLVALLRYSKGIVFGDPRVGGRAQPFTDWKSHNDVPRIFRCAMYGPLVILWGSST